MVANRRRMNGPDILELIEAQEPWRALDGAFYHDPGIYQREVDRILLRSWLYAGHVSEIPGKGDYLLLEFAGESVIVMRASEQARGTPRRPLRTQESRTTNTRRIPDGLLPERTRLSGCEPR